MPMTLISRTTLTTSAASVTFSSIPQTYQTLKLVVSARTTQSNVYGADDMKLNTSSSGYSGRVIEGTGSAANSATLGTTNISYVNSNGNTATSNTFGSSCFDIPNYAGSAFKVISYDGVTENNATNAIQNLVAALWSNGSAVTSITLTPAYGSGTYLANSTFSLYGVS